MDWAASFVENEPNLKKIALKGLRPSLRRRYDWNDLVQQTFLHAWAARKRFDGKDPAAWLATILRNVLNCVHDYEDQLKRDVRKTQPFEEWMKLTSDEGAVEIKEFWEAVRLRGGLETLPAIGRAGKLPEPRGREPENAKERWNWLRQERNGRGRETLEFIRRFV